MKILVTCPPMIKSKEHFIPIFDDLGWEAVIPDFEQSVPEEELCLLVKESSGWIIGDDSATHTVFASGKSGKLKAAVKWGVGTDNIDFEACKVLGIPIINTPNMFGEEVSDLAIAYLLSLARSTVQIDRMIRKGVWHKPQGISIQGKTIGVVGFGDIGKNLCKKLDAFNVNTIVWDPFANNIPTGISHELWPNSLQDCDFLIFTCALNKDTRHMFNNKIQAHIKPGLRLINVSRGPLIDEDFLFECIERKYIHSVALDVFEEEPITPKHFLLENEDSILGSHNASNTLEAVQRTNINAINSLRGFLEE